MGTSTRISCNCCQQTERSMTATTVRNRRAGVIACAAAFGLILNSWVPAAAAEVKDTGSIFGKGNLVAWCIVPFDAKKRGPEERAEMLERLGIKRLAYDYR